MIMMIALRIIVRLLLDVYIVLLGKEMEQRKDIQIKPFLNKV